MFVKHSRSLIVIAVRNHITHKLCVDSAHPSKVSAVKQTSPRRFVKQYCLALSLLKVPFAAGLDLEKIRLKNIFQIGEHQAKPSKPLGTGR